MISTKFALEQIRRMAQLDFYPRGDDVAVLELVTAAAATAKTEALLKSAVDEFVKYSAACPKPAELTRMIFQKGEAEYQTRPTVCNQCGDSGFITVRGKYSGPNQSLRERYGDQEFEAAAPCPCRSAQKATA